MPSRRDVLKSITAGAGVAATGSALKPGKVAAAHAGTGVPQDLNIVMLILDDQNDWVGYLGNHPQATTPNIDRLADTGVAFTQAFCAHPLCNPSRVSTMSGLSPFTTGIIGNDQDGRSFPHLIDHFQASGYKAIRAGKVFHNSLEIPTWDRVIRDSAPTPAFPPVVPAMGADVFFPWGGRLDSGPNALQDIDMRDFRTALAVSDFLDETHQQPFVLCYGANLPHGPWYVPQRHFDLFPPQEVVLPLVLQQDLDDIPPGGVRTTFRDVHASVLAADVWPDLVRGYLAASHFVDTCIGQVLDALEQSAYKDNTIVVVWSDHGYHLGEKEHWGKWTLWDEALRVPFIIRHPDMNRAGHRCHRVVSLVDLFPTLCELTHTAAPGGLDGRSLASLLEAPAMPWNHPALSMLRDDHVSVRSERWRYIRHRYRGQWQEELYDCCSDPMQTQNLADNNFFEPVKAQHLQLLEGDETGPTIACGVPSINSEADAAAFLWKDCGTGKWHFLIAGDSGRWARHTGSLVSDQPILGFVPVNLEFPTDVVDTSNPNRIEFQLITTGWHDGFNFSLPAGAQVSVTLNSTSTTPLLIGSTREPYTSPFQFIA